MTHTEHTNPPALNVTKKYGGAVHLAATTSFVHSGPAAWCGATEANTPAAAASQRRNPPVLTDAAVTCKRCLKAMAVSA